MVEGCMDCIFVDAKLVQGYCGLGMAGGVKFKVIDAKLRTDFLQAVVDFLILRLKHKEH